MERKIGEIFEYNGEWYQCIKNGSCFCYYCDFGELGDCHNIACTSGERKDGKEVSFKKLEKVGEPYIIGNKLIQRYKIYPTTFNINVYGWYYQNLDVKSWTIDIEIKQNKEDMSNTETLWYGPDKKEAKSLKLSNLKPFSLEAAKAGKPVCTRDGRKARIICFDREFIYEGQNYCIVALIKEGPYNETVYNYTENGLYNSNKIHNNDLMMLSEKKEGWVNVYKGRLLDTKSYPTKKEAFAKACQRDYVDTVKIEWQE